MKKSFKKVFWLVLVLVISNSLAYLDPQTLLSEPDKELPDDSETIILEISDSDNDQIPIGDQGTFSLVTDFIDNEKGVFDTSDIEELTSFNASLQIYYNNSEFNRYAQCRLWKPLNEPIYTFCKLEKSLDNGTYEANFEGYIKYKGYSIYIVSTSLISIKKINSPLPLLYSSQQNIVIEKGKENYELVFKIEEYNNELLLLRTQDVKEILALDECSQKGKEMKCIIRKQTIEKFLACNEQIFFLQYKSDNEVILTSRYNQFRSVFEIVVTDNTIQKKDVYVYVAKLLEHDLNLGSQLTFETTITDIDDFTSKNFQLTYNGANTFQCFLKKITGNPLLILCSTDSFGYGSNITIQKINEKRLDDVSIKYDFLIAQGFNYGFVTTRIYGVTTYFAYPKVLDFTLKDTYTIDFLMSGSLYSIQDIRLNPNSQSLDCSIIGIYYRCIVPKSHFENEESGYFFAHYQNYYGEYCKFYELSPIQVILPKNMDIMLKIIPGKKQIIGKKGAIILSTNYNDYGKNVFDSLNIDNYINFRGTIMDYNNKYNANCKIWKPKDENITIICKLNEILGQNKVILNEELINYKNYKIHIYQEKPIEVDLYSYHIPFLYYDNQTIDIDNKDSYELKFKVESYNNDLLYIKGKTNNYAVLENCKRNGNDLNCNIQKNKLEEILTLSGEQFTVGTMNDNEGLIQFEYVSNITINYNNVIKEDLFINITKIVGDTDELENPIAFETNITTIPNFISKEDQRFGYFKKTTGRPLILFYNNYNSYSFYFNIDKEEIINNTHYKYNFRVQPCYFYQRISKKLSRDEIYLIYPEELNFSSEDSLIIRYIAHFQGNPDNNIKFNPNSPDIECEYKSGMKRCNVSLSHFVGDESGYYDTYHKNDDLLINYEVNKINVTLPKEDINIIEIYVKKEDNYKTINIGQNRLIYFITNYTDSENIFDESDIEEKTTFETKIADQYYNDYKATCRLWKPGNLNIRVFCNLSQNFNQNNIRIYWSTLSYNGKKIAIKSERGFAIKISNYYSNLPFLYSAEQILNLGDGKNIYDLTFKIGEYNGEQLVLITKEHEFNHIVLDKCSIEGNDLKCKITREKIMEILIFSGQIFKCEYLDKSNGQLSGFDNIFNIVINYNDNNKENVYIGITNLLTNVSSTSHYLVYETNITSISNIITNKFQYLYRNRTEIDCFMKKALEKPLLLLCQITDSGRYSLGEIEKEIRLENITIKYNLLIQPVVKNETFVIESNNINTLLSAYPMVLDYYYTDSIDIIFYNKDYSEYSDINEIVLNPNNRYGIPCKNIGYIKRCSISSSHFNSESGYYYTYYYLYKEYFAFYELSPIQVILPKRNEIIIRIINFDRENDKLIGQNGAIAFIIKYDDKLLNIFNFTTIEKDIDLKPTFLGNDTNYTANCSFWKPENSDIRLICKFNENIMSEYITLNKYNFEYNNQTIIIVSESNINIIQSNSSIAFLYSNEQYIEIKGNEDNIIRFKKAAYNKETLILNNTYKNIILDCREETNEIICPIKSEKITEILTYSGEEFGLYQLTDSGEKLALDFVSKIIIINDNIQKQLININNIKLLTPMVDLNTYISYETNIKDIPKISTDSFNIATNKNSNLNCFFKKNNNNDPLLLLCKAENYGNFTLGKIKDNYIDDINILYHFDIIATQNDEICLVSSTKGPKIYSVYPESLDFRSNDKLIINYLVDNPDKFKGIKLNNDSSSELECQNKNGIKECIVPKTHFTSNGDYYTYYTISRRYKSISYEISKIHVILEDDDDDSKSYVGIIVGSVIGGLVVIIIIAFLVWRFCKKKNDSPEEKKEVILLSNKELELKNDQ